MALSNAVYKTAVSDMWATVNRQFLGSTAGSMKFVWQGSRVQHDIVWRPSNEILVKRRSQHRNLVHCFQFIRWTKSSVTKSIEVVKRFQVRKEDFCDHVCACHGGIQECCTGICEEYMYFPAKKFKIVSNNLDMSVNYHHGRFIHDRFSSLRTREPWRACR